MSDTPRTDSAQCEGLLRGNAVPTHVVHVTFARQLERELDQLLERLSEAEELIREIRDDEVNAQDETDKFLRDHKPSELAKMRADNAELLERLRERTESHLAASARDVQTIQRQAVMLERLAAALKSIAWVEETGNRDFSWTGEIAFEAFSAYDKRQP